ncbi:MAG: hypothetical protein K0U93_15585 [Gammaproteobacteria bacterium]|nr:hypothetical protein [Gammaproteobacteria bacterium]
MRLFTDHPATVGETYGQHMKHASQFGWAMFVASLACFVHAIFPWLCLTTGSDTVRRLHDRMVVNRTQLTDAPESVVAEGAD